MSIMFGNVLKVSLLAAVCFAADDNVVDDQNVYTSCDGLKDGMYYMKLSISDKSNEFGPTLLAKCSNGFIMIDYSIDNNWQYYFSSWFQWHYGIAGSTKADLVNWQNWFLPDSNSFIISKQCDTCDVTSYENHDYGEQTGFYANATVVGCYSNGKSKMAADMDFDSYSCQICSQESGAKLSCWNYEEVLSVGTDEVTAEWYQKKLFMGNCYLERLKSDIEIDSTFSECTTATDGSHRPTIGIDGRNCMCTRVRQTSSTAANTQQFKQDLIASKRTQMNELLVSEEKELERLNTLRSDNNIVYLSQSDFMHGTYRIKESGTYIVTEDIIFSFNEPIGSDAIDSKSGRYISPNAKGNWWPRSDQNDKYPGAMDTGDSYFSGFFAGITVECDDVVLDLNGKTLKMSKEYYYQQNFFSLIQLSSQAFLPGQGIGFFGADPQFASNVEIKNGVLGLSSHHCIMGMKNKDITISNIDCHDFTTHGMQFNGFENLNINNVEISSNAQISYLNVEYFNMRLFLPRFYELMEELDIISQDTSKTNELRLKLAEQINMDPNGIPNPFVVKFASMDDDTDAVSMQELIDECILKLDISFNYVVYGIEYKHPKDETSYNSMSNDPIYGSEYTQGELYELFKSAKEAFVNYDSETGKILGIPYGSALYGLFLNYPGSGIPGFYLENKHSYQARLENVHIHDLAHETKASITLVPVMESMGKVARAWTNMIGVQPNLVHLLGREQYNQLESLMTDPSWDSDTTTKEKMELFYPRYVGNIATHLTLAYYYFARELSSEFMSGLGLSFFEGVTEWAMANSDLRDCCTSLKLICNADAMLHVNKGLFGLRTNGAYGVTLSNVKIENLLEASVLGSDMCGEYKISHANQQVPYQQGFTGNYAQAISTDYSSIDVINSLEINNIESYTGKAIGMSLWPGSEVLFDRNSNVVVKGITAGMDETNGVSKSTITEKSLSVDSQPNTLPEACGIRVYNDKSSTVDQAKTTMREYANIDVLCVSGHAGCLGDETMIPMKDETAMQVKTNVGQYNDNSGKCGKVLGGDVGGNSSGTMKLVGIKFSRPVAVSMIISVALMCVLVIVLCMKNRFVDSADIVRGRSAEYIQLVRKNERRITYNI